MTDLAAWLAAAVLLLGAVVVLWGPLRRLGRLLVRCLGGLAVLGVLSQVGEYIGITLGVNLVNALVLGVLGVPGFGLLLMLQWVLQTV